MVSSRKPASSENKPKRPPATTPEARENQMVALAFDLAEKQLAEGTASAQVVSHYLKLGSTRERLEREKLARENELLRSRIEALASTKQVEELYRNALNAMRSYAGQEVSEDDEN